MGVCTYCRKDLKKSVITRIFRENCKGMKMDSFLFLVKCKNRNDLLVSCIYHLLKQNKTNKIKETECHYSWEHFKHGSEIALLVLSLSLRVQSSQHV